MHGTLEHLKRILSSDHGLWSHFSLFCRLGRPRWPDPQNLPAGREMLGRSCSHLGLLWLILRCGASYLLVSLLFLHALGQGRTWDSSCCVTSYRNWRTTAMGTVQHSQIHSIARIHRILQSLDHPLAEERSAIVAPDGRCPACLREARCACLHQYITVPSE